MRRWQDDLGNVPAETVELHVNLLNDRARTLSYLDAIQRVVRPGDVVVDVGTGTGIYAAAAARAGARHVYAIEAGPIAGAAKALFEANGLADRITIVRGVSTRVTLPERGDVLISELIGDEPLAEGVVGVTKDALRRLLRPGARLIPSAVGIYGVPVSIPRQELARFTFVPERLRHWRSQYHIGFDALARVTRLSGRSGDFGFFVNPFSARTWPTLGDPVLLADIDFRRWQRPSVYSTKSMTIAEAGELNGMLVYFELKAACRTFLSTHPSRVDDHNHWLSPLRVFGEPIQVTPGRRFFVTYWYSRTTGAAGCALRAR